MSLVLFLDTAGSEHLVVVDVVDDEAVSSLRNVASVPKWLKLANRELFTTASSSPGSDLAVADPPNRRHLLWPNRHGGDFNVRGSARSTATIDGTVMFDNEVRVRICDDIAHHTITNRGHLGQPLCCPFSLSIMSSNQDDKDNKKKNESSPLKPAIHAAVEATNHLLAELQSTTEKVQRPIVAGLDTVSKEGSYVAANVMHAYERRHEYGPLLVLGTSAVVGGVVTLRRGRVPAVIGASLAGGLAYLAVYESIDVQKIPDYLFGTKK